MTAYGEVERELAVLLRRARAWNRDVATEVHPDLQPRGLRAAGPGGRGRQRPRQRPRRDYFGIDKGAISRQVALLERLGLVVREPDPHDGRAQRLVVTDEGRKRIERRARRPAPRGPRAAGPLADGDVARCALLPGSTARWTARRYNQQDERGLCGNRGKCSRPRGLARGMTATHNPPEKPEKPRRRSARLRSERGPVLLALMLSTALVALDATIIATAVPSIVRDLGGFSQFPWLFSIYLLTQAVTVPLYGKLADVRRPPAGAVLRHRGVPGSARSSAASRGACRR